MLKAEPDTKLAIYRCLLSKINKYDNDGSWTKELGPALLLIQFFSYRAPNML